MSKAGSPECRAVASPRLVAMKAAYRCIHLASASKGVVLGRQDRRGVRAGVDFATEDGGDQVGALRKMAIERADADAGLLGDLSHRSVHARGREHRHGRLQQRVDVALRVGAHAADPCGLAAPTSSPWSSGLSLTTTST